MLASFAAFPAAAQDLIVGSWGGVWDDTVKANIIDPMVAETGAASRRSNNAIDPAVQAFAVTLVKESYADFGPTLAAEMLLEHHHLKVSRETLRKWMQAAGLWLSRKQRRTFHQPGLRREYFGELIQIDGSDHRWFEDRAPACTLLVFIDDATSRLMQLRFVKSESTFSYFETLELYLRAHGRPVAFYSDKHTVFRVAQQGAIRAWLDPVRSCDE